MQVMSHNGRITNTDRLRVRASAVSMFGDQQSFISRSKRLPEGSDRALGPPIQTCDCMPILGCARAYNMGIFSKSSRAKLEDLS